MPITPSLRHCSNKYKLAREGEKDKEKDEDFEKVKVQLFFFFFFFFLCSQVELKELTYNSVLNCAAHGAFPHLLHSLTFMIDFITSRY